MRSRHRSRAGCLLVVEAAAEHVDVAPVAEHATEVVVSPVRVRVSPVENRLLSRNSSRRRGAEKMRGTRDSPAGVGWITIASVVLEPRAENGLRDVRVAIVGAGFGGIGAAIRLREAGYEDLVILERDDGLGGTWWANTYPGCACDVAAHLYSFSFALNPDWSRFFAPQAEILDYLRRVARDRGIEPLIRFGTEVTGARWDEHASRWRVETDRGALSAQVLVSAAGGLTEPK